MTRNPSRTCRSTQHDNPTRPAFSLQRTRDDKGFTLIELLVVIVVIGILIAVAAPSFLGQQNKAHDSSARQSLAVTYKAAKTSSVEREGAWTVGEDLVSEILSSEPQLAGKLTQTNSPAKGELGACSSSTTDRLMLQAHSNSGKRLTQNVEKNGRPVVEESTCEEEDEEDTEEAAEEGLGYTSITGNTCTNNNATCNMVIRGPAVEISREPGHENDPPQYWSPMTMPPAMVSPRGIPTSKADDNGQWEFAVAWACAQSGVVQTANIDLGTPSNRQNPIIAPMNCVAP